MMSSSSEKSFFGLESVILQVNFRGSSLGQAPVEKTGQWGTFSATHDGQREVLNSISTSQQHLSIRRGNWMYPEFFESSLTHLLTSRRCKSVTGWQLHDCREDCAGKVTSNSVSS